MKNLKLWFSWLCLFILCAALGFIPTPRNPLVAALLALLCVAFFLLPAFLLRQSLRQKESKTPTRILLISACSLGITVVLFIANTLSVLAPDKLLLGNVLNALLVVFSAPMYCAPISLLSLFGWACLLFASLSCRKSAKIAENA